MTGGGEEKSRCAVGRDDGEAGRGTSKPGKCKLIRRSAMHSVLHVCYMFQMCVIAYMQLKAQFAKEKAKLVEERQSLENVS